MAFTMILLAAVDPGSIVGLMSAGFAGASSRAAASRWPTRR